MNKKGFTLIELLAVIVLLAVIGGIATTGVISFINTSRLKSEKIFVDKISNLIDDYLDLYPPTIKTSPEYEFNKCTNDSCSNSYIAIANKMLKKDNTIITIKDLVNEGIVSYEDLVNPKNKLKCFSESTNPEILVYKDNEYVYHYYVNLSNSNTLCEITSENSVINNLPEDLKNKLTLS